MIIKKKSRITLTHVHILPLGRGTVQIFSFKSITECYSKGGKGCDKGMREKFVFFLEKKKYTKMLKTYISEMSFFKSRSSELAYNSFHEHFFHQRQTL